MGGSGTVDRALIRNRAGKGALFLLVLIIVIVAIVLVQLIPYSGGYSCSPSPVAILTNIISTADTWMLEIVEITGASDRLDLATIWAMAFDAAGNRRISMAINTMIAGECFEGVRYIDQSDPCYLEVGDLFTLDSELYLPGSELCIVDPCARVFGAWTI